MIGQLTRRMDGIFCFTKEKNYIPQNTELRREIVQNFHDHETAGHPGEIGTYNAVRQHYWWPGLHTFVKNYVQGCGICQQFKIDRSPSKLTYSPTEGAKSLRPFANCSMDLITDLPPADGYDSILVLCETRRVVKNNLKGCKGVKLMESVVFQDCDIYYSLHCKRNSTS